MGIPAVTILIDTYDHERFIEEAIVSALEQDFPRADTEILVVDDGSTDRTPEIVRKFQPHVRAEIDHPENRFVAVLHTHYVVAVRCET